EVEDPMVLACDVHHAVRVDRDGSGVLILRVTVLLPPDGFAILGVLGHEDVMHPRGLLDAGAVEHGRDVEAPRDDDAVRGRGHGADSTGLSADLRGPACGPTGWIQLGQENAEIQGVQRLRADLDAGLEVPRDEDLAPGTDRDAGVSGDIVSSAPDLER